MQVRYPVRLIIFNGNVQLERQELFQYRYSPEIQGKLQKRYPLCVVAKNGVEHEVEQDEFEYKY